MKSAKSLENPAHELITLCFQHRNAEGNGHEFSGTVTLRPHMIIIGNKVTYVFV